MALTVTNPIKLIKPRRHSDDRGWFSETYVETRWAVAGIDVRLVQDNHSYSASPGTIRGIHFQRPPHAQAKLVRCIRGRILDYAVDLRVGSPTYGQHVCAELSAENGHQLFIPVGFGHAFMTLERDTEVIYKVSDYYAPDCDGGVLWNCPNINIQWPLEECAPVLSAKDERLPTLSEFASPFQYTGDPLAPIDG